VAPLRDKNPSIIISVFRERPFYITLVRASFTLIRFLRSPTLSFRVNLQAQGTVRSFFITSPVTKSGRSKLREDFPRSENLAPDVEIVGLKPEAANEVWERTLATRWSLLPTVSPEKGKNEQNPRRLKVCSGRLRYHVQ